MKKIVLLVLSMFLILSTSMVYIGVENVGINYLKNLAVSKFAEPTALDESSGADQVSGLASVAETVASETITAVEWTGSTDPDAPLVIATAGNNEYTLSGETKSFTNASIKVTGNVELQMSHDITLDARIGISQNAHLTIKSMKSGGDVTIMRNSTFSDGHLIHGFAYKNDTNVGGSLTIEGSTDSDGTKHYVVLDGNNVKTIKTLVQLGTHDTGPANNAIFKQVKFQNAINTCYSNENTTDAPSRFNSAAAVVIASKSTGTDPALLFKAGQVSFTDCVFDNLNNTDEKPADSTVNYAGSAVAITPYYVSETPVTFAGCTFSNCKGFEGGAIRMGNKATTNLSDTGKAYMMESLVLDDCDFTNCTSLEDGGGAIYALTSAKEISIDKCNFTNCNGSGRFELNASEKWDYYGDGGAICVSPSATIGEIKIGTKEVYNNVENPDENQTVFDNCTAQRNGGAIGSYGKNAVKLTCDNVKFINCKAKANATLKAELVAKSMNYYGHGGAVSWMSGDITLTENCDMGEYKTTLENGETVQVYSNIADTDGGSGGCGGALYVACTTDDEGNFIPIKADIRCNIVGNEARTGGGAFIARGIDATLVDAKITNNKSAGNGGGLYAKGVDLNKQQTTTTITLTGSTEISNNISGDGGGGIFTYNDNSNVKNVCVVNIGNPPDAQVTTLSETENVIISNNQAVKGGGVCAGTEGTVVQYSGKITGNIVYRGGAGVFLARGGDATKFGGKYTQNGGEISYNVYRSVPDPNNPGKDYPSNGGGVHVDNGTYILNAGSVINNKTNNNGGGIFNNYNGTVTINSGIISNNGYSEITDGESVSYTDLALNGGGIFNYGNLTVSSENSIIKENRAKYNGGGVYSAPSVDDTNNSHSLTLTGCVIDSNTTDDDISVLPDGLGGGIYLYNRATATIECSVTNNNSAQGGGIFVDAGSDATINNATITGNQSKFGGGVNVQGYPVYSDPQNQEGLIAGELTSNATIKGNTIISQNRATSNNRSQGKGGGVLAYAKNDCYATIEVKGSQVEISDNSATYYGGGVYISSDSTYTQTEGGTITENTSINGGGLAALNGGVITLKDVTVTKNVATCSDSRNNPETLYQGNDQLFGVGGGVYVASGEGSAKKSTFKYSESTDTGELKFHSNTAKLAANEVFASGKNTLLDMPNVKGRTLSGAEIDGWVEDYRVGDTQYATYTANRCEPVRYKNVSGTPEIPLDQTYEVNVLGEADVADGHYINVANSFICMTLSKVEGTLKVSQVCEVDKDEIFYFRLLDENNNLMTGYDTYYYKIIDNRTLEDNIESNAGTAPDDKELLVDGTYKVNSKNAVKWYGVKANETFGLKHGQTAVFISTAVGNYKVEQVKTSDQEAYINSVKHKTWVDTDGVLNPALVEDTHKYIEDAPVTDALEVALYTEEQINNKETVAQFKNTIRSISVNLKYYLRKVTNGQPADMSDTSTTYTVTKTGSELLKYYNNGLFDYQQIIVDTGVQLQDDANNNPENIIDNYVIWTTQTEAVAGVKGVAVRQYEDNEDFTFHTNQYGYTQENGYWNDGAETPVAADGEKWVTYLDGNGTDLEITEYPSADQSSLVSDVNIWLYNKPRTYKVEYYSVEEGTAYDSVTDTTVTLKDADGNVVGDGYVIITGSKTDLKGIYYNQRMGMVNVGEDGPDINSNTNHLKQYGISGFTNEVITTAETMTIGGTTYYFQYWSYDENGTQIATTDIHFNYRVTRNLKLYPVYGAQEYTGKGVTSLEVLKDYFVENGTQKIRLNTTLNPYGYEDYDQNIKGAAVVYVRVNQHELTEAQLEQVRGYIKKMLDGGYTSANISLTVDVKVTASGLKYDVQANDGTEADTIARLTNKNRIQFTTKFSESTLTGTRMLAYTAMNYYEGQRISGKYDWIVSDNYVDYNFLTAEN